METKAADKRKYEGYIGVFDSGLGGISILRSLTDLLPNEDFIYYGDSANAPYGEKTKAQVRELSENIVSGMINDGVKAIVIACNTATSASASYLRAKYDLPIIGVEPALKPAALNDKDGTVLVMATPVTLSLEKYQKLLASYSDTATCVSLPCPGLASAIEHGEPDSEEVKGVLEGLLRPYSGKATSVVLGCTHYPFVRKQIREIMGDAVLYDSAEGTARELKRVLEREHLLKAPCSDTEKIGVPGRIIFRSSLDTPEEIAIYKKFYAMDF